MDKFEKFAGDLDLAVKNSKSFLLMPHVNMDGDALGTLLAFYHVLKRLGKEITIYTNESIPTMLNNLPGVEEITDELPDKDFDCAVLFECPTYRRSPLGNKFRAKIVVNVDHHPDNDQYGDINYVDTTASSVGEIFYYLFSKLNYPLTREVAVNLYVAIYTDTGGFRYSNTTYRTHQAMSEILRRFKLDTDNITRKVDREVNFESLKALAEVIGSIKIHEEGVATAILTRHTIKKYRSGDSDSHIFIKEIFRIRGVHTMAILRETTDGKIKVSFRSILIPVNKIAAIFGGGGHPRAAGCLLKNYSDIHKARSSVLKEILKALKTGEKLSI